jgi:hypothetical protein
MSRVKPHDKGIMEIRAHWGGSRREARFQQTPENEGFTLGEELSLPEIFFYFKMNCTRRSYKMERKIQDRVVREIIASSKAN